MAKNPKKGEELVRVSPPTVEYEDPFTNYNPEDYSWADEAVEDIESHMAPLDDTDGLRFRPKWNGAYYIRFFPVVGKESPFVIVGNHWNVYPVEDDYSVLPCPRANHNQDCVICSAFQWAFANKFIKRDDAVWRGDKQGRGSMKCMRKGYARCFLVNFEPDVGERDLPDLGDEPKFVIFEFPIMLVQNIMKKVKKFRRAYKTGKIKDGDFHLDDLFHPDKGFLVKLTKSPDITFNWELEILSKREWPIPEEFRDFGALYRLFDIKKLVPDDTNDDLMRILQFHQRSLPDFLINFLSHQVDQVVSLPEGKNFRAQFEED